MLHNLIEIFFDFNKIKKTLNLSSYRLHGVYITCLAIMLANTLEIELATCTISRLFSMTLHVVIMAKSFREFICGVFPSP